MKKSYIVGVIVLIIALAAGGYAIFHKSPAANNSNSSTAGQNNTPPASSSVIETKTSSSQGKYLADPTGRPLYTYGADTSGVSNCTGSCLTAWPPYAAVSSTASLPSGVSTIKRADDNETQYTYKGLPLYYFTADSNDQPTGDGVQNFHLAKP